MKSQFYHLKQTVLLITLLISIFFLSFQSSVQAATNLLKNPSFESGTTNWQLALKNGASASFSTNSSTHSDGARSGQVVISKSTSNPSDIQLFQSGLPMTAGQLYTVTFWARATTARGMQSVVQQSVSPSAIYGSKTITLSNSWQQYSYTFTPSVSQSNVLVGFNMSYATGSVYLDNISYSSTVVPTPTLQPTATPTPTVIPTATPTPTPTVPTAILYGKTGTFGSLGTSLPTGQSLQTVAVTNWGFNPGESEFFSTLDPNGEVVLGTNPQTDNESYATADQMNIGVFDPIGNTFRNIVIPTSAGAYHVTNPFYSIGGGSVDGITPVTVGGTPRIAFISAVPYNGWDTNAYGEYPSLGYLDLTTGSLQYNQALSFSSDQLHANSTLGASACPFNTNIFNQQVASCRGLAEMGVLPLSQKLVMTQYFPDQNAGEQSGRIIVMGTDGTVSASYTYPNIPNGSGGYYSVNPREIDVDPTSTGDLEYFSIIFDVTDNGVQTNFPLQEFAYNRTTNQIVPVSAPILSGQTNSTGQAYRFETAKYDAHGNLWATQAVTNSLFGGPIVVYASISGGRKLEATCTGTTWGMTCPPDQTASNTDAYGQTRSFTEDPQTHTMFAATLSGYLLRIKQASSGASLSLTSLPAINLGLDQLVDRTTHYVGFRKGVVDPTTRSLYVPVVQVANPADCPTWPGSTPCTPKTLDQWLYRFDLNALSS